jgi:hypothetical protein
LSSQPVRVGLLAATTWCPVSPDVQKSLYGILNDHNRFKIGEGAAPWNAPPPGAVPTMDGFVTDYISACDVSRRAPR